MIINGNNRNLALFSEQSLDIVNYGFITVYQKRTGTDNHTVKKIKIDDVQDIQFGSNIVFLWNSHTYKRTENNKVITITCWLFFKTCQNSVSISGFRIGNNYAYSFSALHRNNSITVFWKLKNILLITTFSFSVSLFDTVTLYTWIINHPGSGLLRRNLWHL